MRSNLSRFRPAAAILLLGSLVATCTSELEPTGTITVTLAKGAGWPDTLAVAEIATVTVTVTDPQQRDVKNVNLQWVTSDTSVVSVTRGTSPLSGIVESQRTGTGTIQVVVSQTGFAPVALSVPVVVRDRGADSLLSVGDVDTIGVALQRVDPSVLVGATVTWSSSDPSILGVAALAADSTRAEITGRVSGTAQVEATVQSQVGRYTFQLPVRVLPLDIIEQPAWSPLITLNDTATFAVTVQDALGRIKTGLKVRWSSTNVAAFTVDSNGLVLAKSRGGGELVATVGAAPFQVAEHRAPLQVVQKWRTVSAGLDHTCAIAADGTGFCWGSNNSGELGAGLTAAVLPLSSRPLAVATSHRFNELQVGDAHTCGEEAQVNLFCWGSRAHGALGDGQCAQANGSCGAFTASEIPVTIISDGNLDTTQLRVEQLLVGGTFTCILARARFGFINRVRRLRCWGAHDVNNNTDAVAFDSTAAVALPLPPSQFADQTTDYVEVAAGGEHVCNKPSILFLNFHIACMGMNFDGELGYGPSEVSGWNPVYQHPDGFKLPVGYADTSGNAIGEGFPLSGLAAGRNHTCAFDAVGVVCWGSNSGGQLGQPAAPFLGHGYPIRASVAVALVSLTAGGEHTCGLTAAGAAYCWGSNSNGQLGNGTIGGANIAAAPVSGGLTFVALSAGGSHTCGVRTDGSIFCWGSNSSGQLGDGTLIDRGAPVRVTESP